MGESAKLGTHTASRRRHEINWRSGAREILPRQQLQAGYRGRCRRRGKEGSAALNPHRMYVAFECATNISAFIRAREERSVILSGRAIKRTPGGAEGRAGRDLGAWYFGVSPVVFRRTTREVERSPGGRSTAVSRKSRRARR